MNKIRLKKVSLKTVGLHIVKSGISVGNPDGDSRKQDIDWQPIYLHWDNDDVVLFDNGDTVIAGRKRVISQNV